MSRMNRIRIVNLNYNNNNIRIDDETFNLGKQNTLFSLRNGGGKSVLVQMMSAPFVHKKYRKAGERPFETYFTTNQPTFILVEWALDQEAGYVLTGMMVRKNQDNKDEQRDELEIINFIHEYQSENEYDITNLPIVSVDGTKKTLKGFHVCRQLFEKLKQDNTLTFDYFDMNQSVRSRAYFKALETYQIYSKEWESIIKKVNIKESGLSELFKEAKDEKGLIEKWFLSTIEDKLNKESNRIKEFETIIKKYVESYQRNETKYERKAGILTFNEETKHLHERVQTLGEGEQAIRKDELHLATMYETATHLLTQTMTEQESLEREQNELDQKKHRLAHEEQSIAIYQLDDEREDVEQEKSALAEKLATTQKQLTQMTHQKYALEAAKYHKAYQHASEEVQYYENQLDIAQKNNEELLPEKQNIGYTLHLHYEAALHETMTQVDVVLKKQHENKEEINQLLAQQKTLITQKDDVNRQLGSLHQQVKSFDQIEQRFATQLNRPIQRSLEGTYSEGLLTKLEHELSLNLEQTKKQLKTKQMTRQGQQQLLHETRREKERQLLTQGEVKSALGQTKQRLEQLEAEQKERLSLCAYINWPESEVLAKDKMIEAFLTKLTSVKHQRLEDQRQLDQLTREYDKLKAGVIFEIPAAIKTYLDEMGITYVSGSEWLKRYETSAVKREKLIAKFPFLPYSLLVNDQDLQTLKRHEMNIPTTVPIPIMTRESLQQAISSDKQPKALVTTDNIHFYVLFDQNLIDEEQLLHILTKKEGELQQVREKLSQRDETISLFETKVRVIDRQMLTKSLLDETKQSVDKQTQQLQTLAETILSTDEAIQKTEAVIVKTDQTIKDLQSQQQKQTDLRERLVEFVEHYRLYHEARVQLNRIQAKFDDILQSLKTVETAASEAESTRLISMKQLDEKEQLLSNLKEMVRKFEGYTAGERVKKDVEDLLARYQAIVEKMGHAVRTSQTELDRAKRRFSDIEADLSRHTTRYQLLDEAFVNLNFEDAAYSDVLETIDRLTTLQTDQREGLHELEKQMVAITTKKESQLAHLKSTLNVEDVLPKSELTKKDFATLRTMLDIGLVDLKRRKRTQDEASRLYTREQNALLSYENPAAKLTFKLDETYVAFDDKTWRETRGMCIRDLNEKRKVQDHVKQQITEEMHRLLQLVVFEDEFFKNPLQLFNQLKHQPKEFMNQYELIASAYEKMLGQLEVDIANSEKVKEEVRGILLDYIKSVHLDLQRIDKNSNITIRDKSLKMLRLKAPDWETNESTYRVRMDNFLTRLTSQCLALLTQNQNIVEFIGSQVTTKGLYDYIVGTANIGIQLYKIEAEREYPISWEQVAKNSGGEGFLSAFVVLSSLLSYMRKDETDLFSTFESGKVLVMDNPFAQTNAAHLLKPLMDLAKKTNTQLICLSGLGGDSIYGRFENIYSLSLVPSSFKAGTEYLKSQQLKGEDDHQVLIPSHIQVEDAIQGLLF